MQFVLHFQHALRLQKRHISHGAICFTNLRVAAISGNSHDGVLDLRVAHHGDMVPQGVPSWQVAIDKRLVDDRHFGRLGSIGILYVPAQSQGDS